MNDTSATSQSGASLLPDGIGALTAVHFVILAAIAIAVIAMIVAGIRRKRMRHHAVHEMKRNAEQAGVPAPSAEVEVAPPAVARTVARSTPEPVTAPEPHPLDDEPIAAAAPLDASPASEAASPEPAPASVDPSADQPVTLLKGLGPKVSATLAERGITTVGQLAALDDDRAAALDEEMGPFRGRMARDRWIEQARFLAAGDRAGFEAVFGKL
jgi:predicted flap endonuclease-1-like 5' DNA nuclease